jgi:hypothetical protein
MSPQAVKDFFGKKSRAEKIYWRRWVTFRWRSGDIWKNKKGANRLWLGLIEGALTKN